MLLFLITTVVVAKAAAAAVQSGLEHDFADVLLHFDESNPDEVAEAVSELWLDLGGEEPSVPVTLQPPPPPLLLPQPQASLCALVSWPGDAATGGPRCIDHFGARLPIESSIAKHDPWSCARWSFHDLPAVRSGNRAQLCLTRVDAAWPEGDDTPSSPRGLAVVARRCTSPLGAAQRWERIPVSATGFQLRPAGSPAEGPAGGLADDTAAGGDAGPPLCVSTHANECRPFVGTSAELRPCDAGEAVSQTWACHNHALSATQYKEAEASLARCGAKAALVFSEIAKRRHDGAITALKGAEDSHAPQLFVNDLHRLCMQPLVHVSGAVDVGIHRCSGVGDPHAHLATDHPWQRHDSPGSGSANTVRWQYIVATPLAQFGRLVLTNSSFVADGLRSAVCLTCVGCERGEEHLARATLTIAACDDSLKNAQLWEYDDGARLTTQKVEPAKLYEATWTGSRSLRPYLARNWCVGVTAIGVWGARSAHGAPCTLARCRCGTPRQRWEPLRMHVEMHVPSATRTEAAPEIGVFGKHMRRTDALVSHAVPRKWLAFRDFSDVYEPVPVPYLEWLARGAYASAPRSALAAAHTKAFAVAETRSNFTEDRPFKHAFVMALFVPNPVHSEEMALYGPQIESDATYAKSVARVNAIFASGDVEQARESAFYQRYFVGLLRCVRFINARLRGEGWGTRVYLSPELSPFASDILALGNVQVVNMAHSSIRTSGTFWRWLAFDDTTLDTAVAIDSDEADGASGGTVLGELWRAVIAWKTQGPTQGHALLRWNTGWARSVRSYNSDGFQYSPIQANVVMAKPKMLSWSVRDSIIGFGLARIAHVNERRFHPHGATRVHQFSRIFDYNPAADPSSESGTSSHFRNLGWGRRLWEYGFDEAWTKHVLYHRTAAEGLMFTVVPRRDSEAELQTELLPTASGAALECANAWFLDASYIARFKGNEWVETDSEGYCSPFNAVAFAVECKSHNDAETWESLHHQRWEITVQGCVRPVLIGEESHECLTVPRDVDRHSKRVLYEECDSRCVDATSIKIGSRGLESNALFARQRFGMRRSTSPAGVAHDTRRGTRFEGELVFPHTHASSERGGATTMCLTVDAAHGDDHSWRRLSLQACQSERSGEGGTVEAGEGQQHWSYDPAHMRLSTREESVLWCLAFPNCGVHTVDLSSLRDVCGYAEAAAAAEVSWRNGRVPAAEPHLQWTQNNASVEVALLAPPSTSSDASSLPNTLGAADAMRKWFVMSGVRSVEHAEAMSFHATRSTFLNEVQNADHADLLLPWSSTASQHFSFVPVQTAVALLPRIERERAYCVAELAQLMVSYSAKMGRLNQEGNHDDAQKQRKWITTWLRKPTIVMVTQMKNAALHNTTLSADDLSGMSLPAYVARIQDYYDARNLKDEAHLAAAERESHAPAALPLVSTEEGGRKHNSKAQLHPTAIAGHDAAAAGVTVTSGSSPSSSHNWFEEAAAAAAAAAEQRQKQTQAQRRKRVTGSLDTRIKLAPVEQRPEDGLIEASLWFDDEHKKARTSTAGGDYGARSYVRRRQAVALDVALPGTSLRFTESVFVLAISVFVLYVITGGSGLRRSASRGYVHGRKRMVVPPDLPPGEGGGRGHTRRLSLQSRLTVALVGGVLVLILVSALRPLLGKIVSSTSSDDSSPQRIGDGGSGAASGHAAIFLNPGLMGRGGDGNDGPDSPRFRYIRYTGARCTGMEQQRANLRAMIADAMVLDRVLVVPRPCIASPFAKKGVQSHWSSYVSLQRSVADIVDKTTGADVSGARLNFVYEEDFEMGEGALIAQENGGKLRATWETVLPLRARERWRIVVKDMSGCPSSLFRRQAQQLPDDVSLTVTLAAAPRIARVADAAIEWLKESVDSAGQNFAAVHVRRGNRLDDVRYRKGGSKCPKGSTLERDTHPEHIARVLGKLLLSSIPPPASSARPTVYIASDERAPGYFDTLDNWFALRTAASFGALQTLEDEDPVLLFECERRILAAAQTRVYTFANAERHHEHSLSACVGRA